MRTACAVILALIAFVLAGTCLWAIINPIFGIAHHGTIHPVKYGYSVVLAAFFAWLAFWWSRKLFEDAHAAHGR